ncbi:MAG: S9 family peptidase [Thermomicrobiales bacterium]
MARGLETDDLYRLKWLDTPRLSPDGTTIAYTEGGLDRARDALVSRVCLVAVGGGPVASPTPDGAFDEQPCWSPGGRHLAFVSDRSGERRLWLVEVESGMARCLDGVPSGAASPVWSPAGEHLVFSAPDQGTDQPHKQLWTIPAAGGVAVRLTAGDCDATNPAWSPDGQSIAFLSNSDIWIAPATGGTPRCLTSGQGPIRSHAWSPDSRAIAYIGHDQGTSQGANFGLWIVGLDGESPRLLTAALDRSIGLTVRADTPQGMGPPDLAWVAIAGCDWLYFCFADRGCSWIGRVDPAGRGEVVVEGERAVLAFTVNASADRLAFIVADAMQPGALCTTDLGGRDEQLVVAPNADWLGEVALSRPEYRPFQADDGELIDAWLVRPLALTGDDLPPLILQIHGGPHYPLGERFYFEFQRLAALGYAVLYANPRGSQGYGEEFATAIRGAWGDRDAQDLMQALDAALADGAGDPQRLGVTGVSYGGYMTHLLLTRTDRVAAAVSENGISNLTSLFAGNPAARPFWTWEMAGTPETEPGRFRDLSPVTHADRIRTPLLLIHAERDENCLIGQSEELCAALAALGREVRLGRLPEEGHLMNLVGRPSHRLLRASWLDDWFACHLHPVSTLTFH